MEASGVSLLPGKYYLVAVPPSVDATECSPAGQIISDGFVTYDGASLRKRELAADHLGSRLLVWRCPALD
jgi:hypothetical protein